MADLNQRPFVYLDEAGIDASESYPYGWSQRGERAFASKLGKHQGRINFISALNGKQLIAPFMFNGYCDAQVFEVYLERCLLPQLLPGTIIIADNAAFHKSSKARSLIESNQCQLMFLPAYSPDLNPIEHRWFPIKNKIRQLLDRGEALDSATEQVLKESCELMC